jgi:hypothetical protein
VPGSFSAVILALAQSGGMPESVAGREEGGLASASRKSSTRVVDRVCHDLATCVPAALRGNGGSAPARVIRRCV